MNYFPDGKMNKISLLKSRRHTRMSSTVNYITTVKHAIHAKIFFIKMTIHYRTLLGDYKKLLRGEWASLPLLSIVFP